MLVHRSFSLSVFLIDTYNIFEDNVFKNIQSGGYAMATFTNRATLTYNGNTLSSNVVTGELVEALSLTKSAVSGTYNTGDTVTYVITATNTGADDLTNLTLTDDLGAYQAATGTAVPLEYNENTVLYYNNGAQLPAPAVAATNPLTINGITVPAGGNATIIYQARLNEFASPAIGGTVENTATFTGDALAAPVTAADVITAADEPDLSINKRISPDTVTEGDTLTYSFDIQNFGNTELTPEGGAVINDTLNPVLNPITVSFNGTTWTEGTNYTYDPQTGVFTTLANQISVPAAAYTQDATTGAYAVTPGESTLTISGTV